MDSSKSWIIQVNNKGQVLSAAPLPPDGVIVASSPQPQAVQASSEELQVQPVARQSERSQHESEGRNAGWIPMFLLGAILLSICGFIADKLIDVIYQQQRQLELERTEQKGFERGLQFQSSLLNEVGQ